MSHVLLHGILLYFAQHEAQHFHGARDTTLIIHTYLHIPVFSLEDV